MSQGLCLLPAASPFLCNLGHFASCSSPACHPLSKWHSFSLCLGNAISGLVAQYEGGLRGVRPLTPEPVLVRLPSHGLEFQQRSVSMGCFLLRGTSPNSKWLKECKGHGVFPGARAGRYPRVRPGRRDKHNVTPARSRVLPAFERKGILTPALTQTDLGDMRL